jgi:prevent-host-death family protein
MRNYSVQHVRDELSDVLKTVVDGRGPVMVADRGKPVAVVISPEQYKQLERQQEHTMEQFWRVVDRIRERNADKDPHEEFAFVTGVIEEVRRERYEQQQREAHGSR